jgi:hypothetical protein
MFKSLIPAIVVASALAGPGFASAQENSPLTRAQVKAELVQLEKAGYKPDSDNVTYPAQLQAAEGRVAPQNGQSSYGRGTDGSSASGSRAPAPTNGPGSIYFGH